MAGFKQKQQKAIKQKLKLQQNKNLEEQENLIKSNEQIMQEIRANLNSAPKR